MKIKCRVSVLSVAIRKVAACVEICTRWSVLSFVCTLYAIVYHRFLHGVLCSQLLMENFGKRSRALQPMPGSNARPLSNIDTTKHSTQNKITFLFQKLSPSHGLTLSSRVVKLTRLAWTVSDMFILQSEHCDLIDSYIISTVHLP